MKLNHLTLSVAGRCLVRDLNLSIEAGQCWTIIGRNGAGKTSLLRVLAGLSEPQQGLVLLEDRPLANWPLAKLARQRGYLPQGRNDAFAYSALETVLSARHPYQDSHYWESGEDLQLAMQALAELDVATLAERDVRSLSGGERQRVAIAALLAQDTRLLLLDEPANALDLAHQVGVMQLLAKLTREQQKTVLMVSHDLNLAQACATHALLLMGDGSWHAGTAQQMLQATLLSECLGHTVLAHQLADKTLFLPEI